MKKSFSTTDLSDHRVDYELKLIHKQIASSEQAFSNLIKDLTNLTIDLNRVESRKKELANTLMYMSSEESESMKESLTSVSQHILNVANNLSRLVSSVQVQVVQPISKSMDELKLTRQALSECSAAKAKQNQTKEKLNKNKSKKQSKKEIVLQEDMLQLTRRMNALEKDVIEFERSKVGKLKVWLTHYTHSCLSYHVRAVEEFTKAYQAIRLLDSTEHVNSFHSNLFPSRQKERIKFVRWNSFNSVHD